MLDFTGERFIPTESGEIRYEHMHRYCWAQHLCNGQAVLDIACGEGYGSAVLARVARSVVGVDVSQEAVDHASASYAEFRNLRFVQGSATRIPVDDASIDIAVSFETLEHLAEHDEMLAELRRVLKPAGLLVISSPNKNVYSDDRKYSNEFHVKELYFDELEILLHRYFGATRYFGQRFVTASALLPLDGSATRYDALSLEGDEVQAKTFVSDQNMYFVAVCAASRDLLPEFNPSLFVERDVDLYTGQQHVLRWASGLDGEHQRLSHRHIELQAEFDERSAWALSLRDEGDRLRQRLGESTRERDEARAGALQAQREIAALLNSRSWRLMAPFRWVARLLT